MLIFFFLLQVHIHWKFSFSHFFEPIFSNSFGVGNISSPLWAFQFRTQFYIGKLVLLGEVEHTLSERSLRLVTGFVAPITEASILKFYASWSESGYCAASASLQQNIWHKQIKPVRIYLAIGFQCFQSLWQPGYSRAQQSVSWPEKQKAKNGLWTFKVVSLGTSFLSRGPTSWPTTSWNSPINLKQSIHWACLGTRHI